MRATLLREVRREPALAWDGGGDGLVFYRAIARNARRLRRPGGRLYFEIHENFADETFRMLTREGFPDTAVRRDLNDKNRMTCSLQRR